MDLDVLVGDWTVTTNADGNTVSSARHSFEWIEDGAFLLSHAAFDLTDDASQVWRDNAPHSMRAVIGRDDRSGRYGYLYSDSRGVNRVYEMRFEGREWHIWGRAGEAFFQRFVGIVSEDGTQIDARWERSSDAEAWELDFEAVYKRLH